MTTLQSTTRKMDDHPMLDVLPTWPDGTIGVLATVGVGPYAIPVTAPERAGDNQILLNLRSSRGSLGRLRRHPRVALVILAAGNVALTARGSASVIAEAESDPGFAKVLVDVDQIHDHRQPAFRVQSGVTVLRKPEADMKSLRSR